MLNRGSTGFILKIVIPAFLAIILFVIAFFAIFLPAFEKEIVDEKKIMIKELADTAWSILESSNKKVKEGKLTIKEAQHNAIEKIKELRYGDEHKDYFWITDMHPSMIMHPYRPELNGKDLSQFSGHGNKKIFVEFVDIVKKSGSGYVRYLWQWKDDPDRIVEKLSYVEEFKPWGWIIGTGVYLNDVEEEIAKMESRLKNTSIVILIIITLLLAVAIWQSHMTEQSKLKAEERLTESREKYKALVTASTEGLIMIIENEYFYVNKNILDLLQCKNEAEFIELDIFGLNQNKSNDEQSVSYFQALKTGTDVPEQYELTLKTKEENEVNVIFINSHISFNYRQGFIIIVKDISNQKEIQRRKLEEERENLIIELQTALLFMNQPISKYMKDLLSADMNTPIQKTAELMDKKRSHAVLLTTDKNNYIGIVTERDITDRAVAKKYDLSKPVFEIMSSPIRSISSKALIFEAALLMQENEIRNLAVRDSANEIIGLISIKELIQVQRYSSATLIKEIEVAESVDAIKTSYERTPLLVKALIDSGAKAGNITRILSSVSELILKKLIDFAIAELGEAPAKFAFMTLGSEGRKEETLITDQDNAIIYENVSDEEQQAVDAYFHQLAELVCNWLNEVGYAFCQGNIMAKNPKWCTSFDNWKKHFSKWLSTSSPQDLLEFNIFFDFRCSYGDTELTGDLRKFINELLKGNAQFFLHFSQNCLLYKPPLNLFGNISVKSSGEHSNTFNIKEAMKPIINFARIYSLENEINESNTLARLGKLFEKGVLTEDSYNDLTGVYNYLMQMRFKHQATAINSNQTPDNHINPKNLSHIEQEMLKKVFSQITVFQSKLSFHYKGTMS